jgi:uncharacterized RDD family membrane protein YckC
MDPTKKTDTESGATSGQKPSSEPRTEKPRSHSSTENPSSRIKQERASGGRISGERASLGETPESDAAPQSEKPDPATRFLAILVDGLVAGALSIVPFVGGIAGAAYFVVRDGLTLDFMDGRSIGKHVMGLRVARLDGRAMDIETSARRNWMWGIGAISGALAYIPIFGWILIPFVALLGLGIGLYEGYRVLSSEDGRRWGDEMAQTKVLKQKS